MLLVDPEQIWEFLQGLGELTPFGSDSLMIGRGSFGHISRFVVLIGASRIYLFI
jgi:hypothetical protein